MKFILATLLFATFSQSSRAELFGRIEYYLHVPSLQIVEPYNFNDDTKTAVYYDYAEGKKKTVNISELSKATKETINGVKQGSIVLLDKEGHKFCETFYVFENGSAYIGCQTDGVHITIGMNRPLQQFYIAPTEILTPEVKSLDGFTKKEKVILTRASGNIKAGSLVRIEAILANGEALVQKVGLNYLDTSSLRLKWNIERVQLSDLEKKSVK